MELSDLEASKTLLELKLLKERRAGDSQEIQRIEADMETLAIEEKLARLKRINSRLTATMLSVRGTTSEGVEERRRCLASLDQFRLSLAEKTTAGLRLEFEASLKKTEASRGTLSSVESDIESASKEGSELALSCETFDQALESVLREVRNLCQRLVVVCWSASTPQVFFLLANRPRTSTRSSTSPTWPSLR